MTPLRFYYSFLEIWQSKVNTLRSKENRARTGQREQMRYPGANMGQTAVRLKTYYEVVWHDLTLKIEASA